MSDNPFAEPDDPDRTVDRPSLAGLRRAAPAPQRTDDQGVAPAGASPSLPGGGVNPLAAAAAPLLQLLTRLRNTGQPPDPGDLRERAVAAMRGFEQRAREAAVPMELLHPAHFALCASLDDVVLNTPWGSTGAWDTRSLVSTFHQEVDSGARFFDMLARLRQDPAQFMPALELMYLCLSLGFQGRYRLSPRGPAEIERLREDLYNLILRERHAPEPELSPRWRGVAAPYRPRRGALPIWVAGVSVLTIGGVLFLWSAARLGAEADTLYAHMIALPPDHMPPLVRGRTTQPPTLSPPPGSTAADRLRTFLKPEIAAGLVRVVGTASAPVIRLRAGGLFSSGSATLAPGAMPLLHRIGAALRDEPGSILVAGYTDDQPIHTVRFPSNFQLSAARAEAARDAIGTTVGNSGRLSAEGRAEADPVAPNATAEGRDQNRRIEITLRRAL